jgi:hypothetical protein
MSDLPTTTKQTRRRNVVSVSLTDEQMAQAVVLGLDPEHFVGAAVDAHTAQMRARFRAADIPLPT